MIFDFSGQAVNEQRSCFTAAWARKCSRQHQPSRRCFPSLADGCAFDGEGVPRQRVPYRQGEVKNLVYARQTAHKLGVQPTGHGFPLPNEYAEAPLNIVMDGDRSSVDDMIKSTDRGLLVTRFWYIREVDPYKKILTGMTRDGTFWIEDGQVRQGVRNCALIRAW